MLEIAEVGSVATLLKAPTTLVIQSKKLRHSPPRTWIDRAKIKVPWNDNVDTAIGSLSLYHTFFQPETPAHGEHLLATINKHPSTLALSITSNHPLLLVIYIDSRNHTVVTRFNELITAAVYTNFPNDQIIVVDKLTKLGLPHHKLHLISADHHDDEMLNLITTHQLNTYSQIYRTVDLIEQYESIYHPHTPHGPNDFPEPAIKFFEFSIHHIPLASPSSQPIARNRSK